MPPPDQSQKTRPEKPQPDWTPVDRSKCIGLPGIAGWCYIQAVITEATTQHCPSPMSAETLNPEDSLHRFGLESFRPGQRDVIDAVLNGDDCLCIMPTGGGKSLCYQLPSVARKGTTLVVSPLIALMKDQVDTLLQLGINATFVNSAISGSEQEERLLRFAAGEYEMLYVAPERFRSPRFRDALGKTDIQLLAIDEAHCISEWGHDFRHDYARLGEFREQIGKPQTIALTATATTDVRDDVLKQLNLKDPKIFVAGFARDNLYYRIENHRSKQAKQQALLEFLRKTPGTGIIYTSTRSSCEEVRDVLLNESSRKVIAYHGGLQPDERRHLQEVFMSGEAEIVVATNAFGMGIDKADVRFVVHFNIPGSLEAYYQEAGRAGRDGKPSTCFLLYSQNDRFIQEFFIENANPTQQSIQKIYEYLCRHPEDPIELTQSDLKEKLGLSIGPDGVGTCERLLEKSGVLERMDSRSNLAAVRIDSDAPNLAELLPTQAKVQRRVARAIGNLVGEHRYERFYFHPKDVCTLCGEEMTAVNRSLRELNRNEWFDYVPPFRGRAVHMLQRDIPFHKLEIDFTRLEERRQSNLAKLDRVIRFATTRRCRQRDILRYFGETTAEKCGHCDNCGPMATSAVDAAGATTVSASGDFEETEQEVTPAMLQMARIVLSGVARSQGKFGKNLVVGMLCGSQSAKIRKWRLDELSTFGLLEAFKQTEVTDVIDGLIALSLVKMIEVDKFRPTVHNTKDGNEVMMGRATMPDPLELEPSLMRKIERKFKNAVAPQIVEKSTSETTAEAGVEEPADAEEPAVGVEPADTEADDAADAKIAVPVSSGVERQPQESGDTVAEEQLDSAAGGSSSESTESTADSTAETTADSNTEAQGLSVTDGAVRPNYYWTWRVFADGYSQDECSQIRGLGVPQLVDHLIRAIENNLEVDPEWILEAPDIAWLEEHSGDEHDVRPLIQDLPSHISAAMAQLFAKCRTADLNGEKRSSA